MEFSSCRHGDKMIASEYNMEELERSASHVAMPKAHD